MPSYVLEATHLSRTANWTALKNQIPIFPPSPVNFFLFSLSCSFPEVLGRSTAGDSHLSVQCWSWNSAVLLIPWSCIACSIAGQELSLGHFPNL